MEDKIPLPLDGPGQPQELLFHVHAVAACTSTAITLINARKGTGEG